MSDTAHTALGNPNTFHEYDDGTAHDPMVVWDLSIGCTATIGFQGDQLVALVSTSDEDKRTGITRRGVTRQQVGDFACQLLTLVGDPLPMAAEQLCDIRYALASEGFCAPDSDEWTSLANIRQRIQDLVDRAAKAEAERDAELGEAYRRGWRAGEVEKAAELAEHDVERVARALFARNHPGRDYDSDAGEPERELHRADARAAIDAMAGGDDA